MSESAIEKCIDHCDTAGVWTSVETAKQARAELAQLREDARLGWLLKHHYWEWHGGDRHMVRLGAIVDIMMMDRKESEAIAAEEDKGDELD